MAQVKGKIVYIEPNEIYNEKGIKFGTGDNINWKPEDLSLSVDLQVIVSDRDNCGKKAICDDFIFNVACNDSKDKYWQSFLNGEQLGDKENEKYLTTNYTDVSYQEIINNKAGSKEALGIQSIDISFDSHFFPIVKMKMIDVRGFSLMMPAEQNYLDNLEHKAEVCQNFFSSLLQFPYPRFALSVKGFYGDRVTFMLSVNDFNSTFNSQTGNFEVEIEFIGHMYGLYSDLPMNYLLIAPYMGANGKEENQYWRTNTLPGGTFTFSDGTPIPTLIKFLEKYERMAETYQEKYSMEDENTEGISQVIELRSRQNLLNQAINEYTKLLDEIGYDNTVEKIECGDYILFFVKEGYIIRPSSNNIKNIIEAYNDNNSEQINFPSSLNPELWGYPIDVAAPLFDYDAEAKEYVIKKIHSYYPILKNLPCFNDLNSLSDEVKGRNVYLIKREIEFINKLNVKISEIDSSVNNVLSKSEQELRDVTKNILGFVPTIENIFRMVFAHIDCFLTSFYTLLSNIDSHKSKRILGNLSGIDIRNTDVIANGTNNFNIPAFTGFYEVDKDNNRVRKYPGEILELRNLDEVYYVEQIYESLKHTKDKIQELKEAHDAKANSEVESPEQSNLPIDWVPLSLIDYYYDKNPYSYLTYQKTSDFLGYLLYFFKVRLSGADIISGMKKTNNIGLLISNECKNAVSEHKNMLKNTPNLKNDLEAIISGGGEKAEEYITSFLNEYGVTSLFNDNNDIAADKINEFPLVFKNLKNIANEEVKSFSSLNGHNVIFKSETEELDYSEYKPIPNTIDISCNYKLDGKFIGGIYAVGDKKCKQQNISYTLLKEVHSNKSQYYFPILQVFEKPKNLFSEEFFKNDITKVSKENLAMTFLCTLIGINGNNLYKFKKNTSSLHRLPKFLALYYGGIAWAKKMNVSKKFPFWINRNGIYTEFTGNKSLSKIGEYDGYSIDEFVAEDANQALYNYFKDWANNEFIDVYNKIKEYLETEEIEVFKNALCFKKNGKVSNLLLDFYSTTVDVIKITNVNKGKNYHFNSEYLRIFASYLHGYFENEENATEEPAETKIAMNETDNQALLTKNAIYYTLKNLYDKWISTYTVNTFKLKTPAEDAENTFKKLNGEAVDTSKISEFESFMFIDTFYNDIRDRFLIDIGKLFDIITEQISASNNRSSLELMTDIAEKNKLLFIALPVFNNFYDINSITNIFTPQNLYNGSARNSRGIGNTYVLMYTHEPSHNLDTAKEIKNSTEFSSDGLDIADSLGDIAPIALESFKNAGYTVPAFGVTFAKQNQMYFKGLSLNMSNPRETDYAIYNRFLLAGQEANGTTNSPSPAGQNLFSIFSNRVYDCGVEMLGCANIMPMMYFQLNNVPMYKGAYMITNVKHHIENGSMTTSFSGTRISKNAIPFNQNVIDIEGLIAKINSGSNEDVVDNPVSMGSNVTGGNTYESEINDKNKKDLENAAEGISEPVKSSNTVFDVAKANYAGQHTLRTSNGTCPYYNTKSTHLCATYTKKIIQAGFEGTELDKYYTGNAFECRNILPKLNFRPIAKISGLSEVDKWKTLGLAEPGDVAVMEHGTYGHICYFYGDYWVSDYIQKGPHGLWPYGNSEPKIVYIFRYAGARKMPSEYHRIMIDKDSNISITDNLGGGAVISDSYAIIGNINLDWNISQIKSKLFKPNVKVINYVNGEEKVILNEKVKDGRLILKDEDGSMIGDIKIQVT